MFGSVSAVAPPGSAWRALAWTAGFTAAWTWLIYAVPALPESGVSQLAVRLTTQVVIAVGAWCGLERTGLGAEQKRVTWLALMVPFTLWASLAWTAAIDGSFRAGASGVPLLPVAILLPVVIGAPPLLLSRRVGVLLDALPASWLVALQVYRVFGGQWLAYWLRGVLPALSAVPAGSGDVLTGLLALPAAALLMRGSETGRRAAILWNVLGLADFAIAISLGLITSPGRLQLVAAGLPGVGIDSFPNVLTPAFVVPSSILLHLLSLRQLRRRAAGAAR